MYGGRAPKEKLCNKVCMYVCMYVTSLKYVIREDTCELNDRTDKARPEDLVPDSFRYYLTREKNRGELLLFSNTLQKIQSTKIKKKIKKIRHIPRYHMDPYASKALE